MSSLLGIYKVRFLRLIFLSLVHCYSGCFRAAVQVCATPDAAIKFLCIYFNSYLLDWDEYTCVKKSLSDQDQRMDPRNKVKQLKI